MIKEPLLGLDKQPEGMDILKTFQTTKKFDKFANGPDAALARMKELSDLVNKQG